MKTVLVLILVWLQVIVFSQKVHFIEGFNNDNMPPEGWLIEDPAAPNSPRWSFSHSHNADGQYQEMKFVNGGTAGFRLISPTLNIEEYSNAHLSFKQLLVGDYGGGQVQIQTRVANQAWNTVWSLNNNDYLNNEDPEIIDFEIPGLDLQEGSFQFCYFINSPSFSVENWYIDDIILYSIVEDDLCVQSITNSKHWVEDEVFIPEVVVSNGGLSNYQNFTVSCIIRDEDENQVSSQAIEVSQLNSAEGLTLTFDGVELPIDEHMYRVEFFLDNFDDDNNDNNTKSIFIDNYKLGRQDILKEFSTGTWCQYCPTASHAIEQMEEEGGYDMAIIEYHGYDPFEIPEGLNRLEGYYNTFAYPSSYTNGDQGGPNYNGQTNAYNYHSQFGSPIQLSISGIETGDNQFEIRVNVTKTKPCMDDYTVLYMAITESDIEYNWMEEEYLHYVNRGMYPNENGTLFDLRNMDEFQQDYIVSVDPSWNLDNLEFVAFVQNRLTKEVYQAKANKLTEIVAIQEINNTEVEVFPNPAQDIIYISCINRLSVEEILIVDSFGRICMHFSNNQLNTNENAIDVSTLSTGVYSICICSQNEIITKKIIIQ